MKTLKQLAAILAVTLAGTLYGQSTGSIKGSITDEKGNGVPFAVVALMDNEAILSGISTDDKGDFTFKDLTPGLYNLQFTSMGYETKKIKGIEVGANKITYVYKTLNPLKDTLITVVVTETFTQSIIDADYSTISKIDIEQIENSPSKDIVFLAVIATPAVVSTPDGKDMYIRGARRGTTGYYVDGEKMIGPPSVAGPSISGMEVLTGGMPAEYGDCTGGMVIITTKDYKWEMRRKEMAKTAREEREEKNPDPKKKKWYFTIH